jgi:hypothetical protein
VILGGPSCIFEHLIAGASVLGDFRVRNLWTVDVYVCCHIEVVGEDVEGDMRDDLRSLAFPVVVEGSTGCIRDMFVYP